MKKESIVKGNEGVYPVAIHLTGLPDEISCGITKREYFAAMALQGLIASGAADRMPYDIAADTALHYADSIIEVLASTDSEQSENR
jgi:hypothetical protein